MKINALVLKAPATNCDIETYITLRNCGFNSKIVHINELIRKEECLKNFNLLVIPGGFSFGDYISAGKIFAVEIYYKLKEEIDKFISRTDTLIVGICNGFQVLVKLGLLPETNFNQEVTLTDNKSAQFECRWVYLKTNKNNPSILKNMPDVITLPVAHAEGNFFTDKNTLAKIKSNNQILFQYCNQHGIIDETYPTNPNGSLENIAGITDKSGRIIGLMPHPERFTKIYQYPNYRYIKYNDNLEIVPYGNTFFNLLLSYFQ